jgi:hypothetical protein
MQPVPDLPTSPGFKEKTSTIRDKRLHGGVVVRDIRLPSAMGNYVSIFGNKRHLCMVLQGGLG